VLVVRKEADINHNTGRTEMTTGEKSTLDTEHERTVKVLVPHAMRYLLNGVSECTFIQYLMRVVDKSAEEGHESDLSRERIRPEKLNGEADESLFKAEISNHVVHWYNVIAFEDEKIHLYTYVGLETGRDEQGVLEIRPIIEEALSHCTGIY
jgi:hypothetical protein